MYSEQYKYIVHIVYTYMSYLNLRYSKLYNNINILLY